MNGAAELWIFKKERDRNAKALSITALSDRISHLEQFSLSHISSSLITDSRFALLARSSMSPLSLLFFRLFAYKVFYELLK